MDNIQAEMILIQKCLNDNGLTDYKITDDDYYSAMDAALTSLRQVNSIRTIISVDLDALDKDALLDKIYEIKGVLK